MVNMKIVAEGSGYAYQRYLEEQRKKNLNKVSSSQKSKGKGNKGGNKK